MADIIPPRLVARTPLGGATNVGRAATFVVRVLDRGEDNIDLSSIAVTLLDPETFIVVGGTVQAATGWQASKLVPWGEGNDSVVELHLQRMTLHTYGGTLTFQITASDASGNTSAGDFSYQIESDPVYAGTDPSPLETSLATAFSNPYVEEFRVALLGELGVDKTHAQFYALAARRARQLVYRERFEGAMSSWWEDEVPVYDGAMLNATPASTLLARRAECMRITRLVLGRTSHFVYPEHQTLITEAMDRKARPLRAYAAAVTLLVLLCTLRRSEIIS